MRVSLVASVSSFCGVVLVRLDSQNFAKLWFGGFSTFGLLLCLSMFGVWYVVRLVSS